MSKFTMGFGGSSTTKKASRLGKTALPGFKAKKAAEKRKKLDQQETAKVYEDFVASFAADDTPSAPQNSFVRGGFIDPDSGRSTPSAPSTYKPAPLFKAAAPKAMSFVKPSAATTAAAQGLHLSDGPPSAPATTSRPKKKRKKVVREIDKFMEEMKQSGSRRRDDRGGRGGPSSSRSSFGGGPRDDLDGPGGLRPPPGPGLGGGFSSGPGPAGAGRGGPAGGLMGSFDNGDPLTTNVYVGNLPPHVTELALLTEFGKFGDIGSVKVMWPRTEEERARARNCGFVNFMKRSSAAKCLEALRGQKVLWGVDLRLGWGKRMAKPSQPLAMPKPVEKPPEALAHIPKDAIVLKVKMPQDRAERRLINVVARFVADGGYKLESLIAEDQKNNPKYKFLFEVESIAHIYYRWRLFSLTQGDSLLSWRKDPYQIMIDGPHWVPPPVPEHIDDDDKEDDVVDVTGERERERRRVERERERQRERDRRRGFDTKHVEVRDTQRSLSSRSPYRKPLPDRERDTLERLLRKLSNDREKIKEAMGFCLDHANYAKDIVETLTEALTILETPIPAKIARLFLVSDVLHNSSSAMVKNASAFRSEFQRCLKEIFEGLHEAYVNIEGRITADKMKSDVLRVLRVWNAWSVFPVRFVDDLEEIFIPRAKPKAPIDKAAAAAAGVNGAKDSNLFSQLADIIQSASTVPNGASDNKDDSKDAAMKDEDDVDGVPLDGAVANDDVDGTPLDDIDGAPMDDIDGVPL